MKTIFRDHGLFFDGMSLRRVSCPNISGDSDLGRFIYVGLYRCIFPNLWGEDGFVTLDTILFGHCYQIASTDYLFNVIPSVIRRF